MGAAERFSLLLDTKASGTQDVQKLNEAVGQYLATTERVEKRTAALGRQQSNTLKTSLQSIRDTLQNPFQTVSGQIDGVLLGLGKVGLVAGGIATGATLGTKALFSLVNETGAAKSQPALA